MWEEKRPWSKIGEDVVLIASPRALNANISYIQAWVNNIVRNEAPNWETFYNNRFNINIIGRNFTNGFYLCSCPRGYKKYPCKHVVLVMVEDGKLKVPNDVMAEDIQGKRGPGRPKKTGKALDKT